MTLDLIEIYTDGACKGNPGPGGWGALLRYPTHEKELCGGEAYTTNNRMELTAVIAGLEALEQRCEVTIYTDSKYVQKGMSEWIHNWKKRDWQTSAKEPVKNVDLWKRLDTLANHYKVSWQWVKGHAGHVENERADILANRGITTVKN